MEKWTAKMVADRLEESVRTLRRLPPVKVQGYFNLWPAIKYTDMEVLQMEFDAATNDNDVYRKIFESRRDPYLLEAGRWHTEINIDDLYPLPKSGQK